MKEMIIYLLQRGIDINDGKISLCDIHNYTERIGWQLHSDETEYRTSEFFKPGQLHSAVARFLFLRKVVNDTRARSAELRKVSDEEPVA